MKLKPSDITPVMYVVGGVLVIAVGFVLYKLVKSLGDFNKDTPYEGGGAAGTLGNATNKVLGGIPQKLGEALGGGLYELFDSTGVGETTYYTVNFPDGTRHAVAASTVKGGRFVWSGRTYQLTVAADGQKWAFPV